MDRREMLIRAGEWLREQRERRGVSARKMAAELDVAPQSINNWELGKNAVPDERTEAIARVLDMPVIEVRRGLGLWVPDEAPPDESPDPPKLQPRRFDDPDEQALWDIGVEGNWPEDDVWQLIFHIRAIRAARKRGA